MIQESAIPNSNWNDEFYGRDPELVYLQNAWHEVMAGEPQLLILLGNTGIGKTRLVQRFYRWLCANYDDGDFWPKRLERSNVALSINPIPSDSCSTMPWLWWGISFNNPNYKCGNDSFERYGLRRAFAALEHNIESLEISLRKKDQLVSATESVARVGLGISTAGISELVLAAADIRVLIKQLGETRQADKARKFSPLDLYRRKIELLEDRLVMVFGALLKASMANNAVGLSTLPVVIIVDDAQWADPTTVKFIVKLMTTAKEIGGQLLVLSTHWETDWFLNKDTDLSFRYEIEQLLIVYDDAIAVSTYTVGNLDELSVEAVLMQALPGLNDTQVQKVIARVGGNPQFLVDIICYFLNDRDFFQDLDFTKELNADGDAAITRIHSLSHLELNLQRYADIARSNPVTAKVLQIASTQGWQFIEPLVEEISEELDLDLDSVQRSIRRAENPLYLIECEGSLGRFKHPGFYEAVQQNLRAKTTLQSEINASLTRVLERWQKEKRLDEYDLSESHALRDLLVDLQSKETEIVVLIENFQELWHQAMDLNDASDYREALHKSKQALRVVQLIGQKDMSARDLSFVVNLEFLWCQFLEGQIHMFLGNVEEAEESLQSIFKKTSLLADVFPSEDDIVSMLSALNILSYGYLGLLCKAQGEHDPALAYFSAAVDAQRAFPSSEHLEKWTSRALGNFATQMLSMKASSLGELDEAHQALDDCNAAVTNGEYMLGEALAAAEGEEESSAILAMALVVRGQILSSLDKKDLAIQDFGSGISLLSQTRQGVEIPIDENRRFLSLLERAYFNRGFEHAMNWQVNAALDNCRMSYYIDQFDTHIGNRDSWLELHQSNRDMNVGLYASLLLVTRNWDEAAKVLGSMADIDIPKSDVTLNMVMKAVCIVAYPIMCITYVYMVLKLKSSKRWRRWLKDKRD